MTDFTIAMNLIYWTWLKKIFPSWTPFWKGLPLTRLRPWIVGSLLHPFQVWAYDIKVLYLYDTPTPHMQDFKQSLTLTLCSFLWHTAVWHTDGLRPIYLHHSYFICNFKEITFAQKMSKPIVDSNNEKSSYQDGIVKKLRIVNNVEIEWKILIAKPMNSWLLRSWTARGSGTGFSHVSAIKVEACKSFLFTEKLVSFIITFSYASHFICLELVRKWTLSYDKNSWIGVTPMNSGSQNVIKF